MSAEAVADAVTRAMILLHELIPEAEVVMVISSPSEEPNVDDVYCFSGDPEDNVLESLETVVQQMKSRRRRRH